MFLRCKLHVVFMNIFICEKKGTDQALSSIRRLKTKLSPRTKTYIMKLSTEIFYNIRIIYTNFYLLKMVDQGELWS